MRGSTFKRSEGHWSYRLTVDEEARALRCTSCHKRHWVSDGELRRCAKCGGELELITARREVIVAGERTKGDAQKALTAEVKRLNDGTYTPPNKLTLGEWFDEWLEALATTRRESTVATYRCLATTHIVPKLGSVRLQKLTAGQLDRLYRDLLAKPLSTRSVRLVHAVVHTALKEAVKKGRLVVNPADAASPPKATRDAETGPHWWTAEQLGMVLDAVADGPLGPLWTALGGTGMRRGEAIGLKWSDVDLETMYISVQRSLGTVDGKVVISEPKTRHGRRRIAIDDDVIDALRDQAKRQLADADDAGNKYDASDGWVFTGPLGEPLNPDRVSRAFDAAVRDVPVPRISLHGLRHTHASILLLAGVHPKVVQERLGHASIAITLDLYSHITEGMDAAAAQTAAALIPRASRSVA
jgi:integrase